MVSKSNYLKKIHITSQKPSVPMTKNAYFSFFSINEISGTHDI